jgi:hypothetical protein
LLKEEYVPGKKVVLLQKTIVKKAKSICKELTEKKIFDKHWMDFEPIFREAGWKVSYDSSAWCETYFDEYYTFSK